MSAEQGAWGRLVCNKREESVGRGCLDHRLVTVRLYRLFSSFLSPSQGHPTAAAIFLFLYLKALLSLSLSPFPPVWQRRPLETHAQVLARLPLSPGFLCTFTRLARPPTLCCCLIYNPRARCPIFSDFL